jgi:hypothetical protein
MVERLAQQRDALSGVPLQPGCEPKMKPPALCLRELHEDRLPHEIVGGLNAADDVRAESTRRQLLDGPLDARHRPAHQLRGVLRCERPRGDRENREQRSSVRRRSSQPAGYEPIDVRRVLAAANERLDPEREPPAPFRKREGLITAHFRIEGKPQFDGIRNTERSKLDHERPRAQQLRDLLGESHRTGHRSSRSEQPHGRIGRSRTAQ